MTLLLNTVAERGYALSMPVFYEISLGPTQTLLMDFGDYLDGCGLADYIVTATWITIRTRKKGKGVNLYSASRVHASNALFVTNQGRRPHGHHVQPADTG